MMPSVESIPVETPSDKYSPPRGKYSCTWFLGTLDVLSGKSRGGGQYGNLFPTAGRMRIESSRIQDGLCLLKTP